jgi:hypothetical protein
MKIIVVDPQEVYASGPDEPLWYVSPYMQRLAEKTGATLFSLTEATRTDIYGAKPDIILGAGHGLPDKWFGYRGNVLMQVGDPIPSPKMLILACYTASMLGPYAYGRGAEYLGWTQEYVFPVEYGKRNSIESILLDPVVDAFSTLDTTKATTSLFNTYTSLLFSPGVPTLVKAMAKFDRDTLASYTRIVKLSESIQPPAYMLAGIAPAMAIMGYVAGKTWTP